MSTSIRVVPKGLVTDPSRLVAGDGGLTQARNVIFRSEGLVEPRAALSLYANEDAIDNDFTRSMHAREWAGETIAALHNGDEYAYYRDNVNILTCEAQGDVTKFRMYSELADGRMMFSTPNGLRMLDQPDQGLNPEWIGHGAFTRMPGAPRIAIDYVIVGANPAGFLANGDTTAYRVTCVRWIEDSAGRRIPIEGAPSDRYVIANNLGLGVASTQLRVTFNCNVRVGDEVRIYRTPANGSGGGDPGDEMVLRYTWRVQEDDFQVIEPGANQCTFDFTDYADAAEFNGSALYTNAGIEGALRGNYRLRTARDLTLYQNKMFYAGGSAGYRQSCVIKYIGEVDTGDKSETLLSARCTGNTCDWTDGNPVISQVPANMFPYLAVGQVVSQSGGAIDDPSSPLGVIESWDAFAFTITLADPIVGSATNQNIVAWDWIGVATSGEGSAYPDFKIFAPYIQIGSATLVAPRNSASSVDTEAVMPVVSGGGSPMYGACEMVATNVYSPAMPWDTNPGELRPFLRVYTGTGADPSSDISFTVEWDASFGNPQDLEEPDQMDYPACDQIAIVSTKPYATSMVLAPTYAQSLTPANTFGDAATLWMSKTNQPESVPLPNFVVVGDASVPITRIFATTDRLWVIKPDGLYSVTCPTDDIRDLVLTLVDGTFRMIDVAPDGSGINCGTWASKVRDTIFAWTRNGIMAIGSGGVVRVDAAIETDIRSKTPSYDEDETEDIIGTPFCAASERESMIVFGASGAFGEGVTTGWCYVLHVESGAWSTFDGLPASSSNDPSIFPSFSEGYGASTTGLWRIPSYAGFLSYLDVPSKNNANESSDRPVTGDRTNVQLVPNIRIQSVTGRTATIDSYPYDITGWRIYDADGAWYLVLSWTSGDPVDTITLDREGAFPGDVTDIRYAAPRTVTYAANQPPFTEKHFARAYTHFQQFRGGTKYDVSFRARGHMSSSDPESPYYVPVATVNYDGPESDFAATYPDQRLANNLEWDKSLDTPTECSRARGLEVTWTQNQADTYFASDGLTVVYGDETDLIEGRS